MIAQAPKKSLGTILSKDFQKHKYKYLLFLPVVAYLFLFCYKPMYGILIAFQNYRPALGIGGSRWVGFKHFEAFFNDVYFWRILRNTFNISLQSILWGFPAPIILALMLNELWSDKYKRVVQSISYIPHFISLVVVCGLIKQFSMTNGVFNDIIVFLGGERSSLLLDANLFPTIYVASGIWQEIGWGTIIYLAALSGIDQELYEAAQIDGAGRWKQTLHITLPCLMPTIMMLLILRMGSVLGVGSEKILLLYNPTTYETADVISTYVYRKGMIDGSFSYSTAVNMFNSIVNVAFLLTTNYISKRAADISMF